MRRQWKIVYHSKSYIVYWSWLFYIKQSKSKKYFINDSLRWWNIRTSCQTIWKEDDITDGLKQTRGIIKMNNLKYQLKRPVYWAPLHSAVPSVSVDSIYHNFFNPAAVQMLPKQIHSSIYYILVLGKYVIYVYCICCIFMIIYWIYFDTEIKWNYELELQEKWEMKNTKRNSYYNFS